MMKKVLFALASVALAATGVTAASASHPTWMCIDSGPDSRYPVSNDDIVDVLTITVGASDDGHPPQSDGCVTSEEGNSEGTLIHVEVTGVADEDGDTPASPDLSCTVPANSNQCSVQPPTSGGGTQTLRAWMDFGEGTQIDRTEGADEDGYPGEMGEPDGTDVSVWTWTHGDPPPDMCGPDQVCWGRVSIKYEPGDHRFHGRIAREHGSCGTGSVTLRKKQSGDSREIFEAQISGQRWEVKFERRVRGHFYATLSRTRTTTFYSDWPRYTCEGDRSPVLKVD
jgi:hypothetical protein